MALFTFLASAITSFLASTSVVGAIGIGGISAISSFVTSAFTSLVIGGITTALRGKPDVTVSRERSIRAPDNPRRVVYGRKLIGGTYAYISSDNDEEHLYVVVMWGGHEFEAIEDIYFNGEPLRIEAYDTDSNGVSRYRATNPRWRVDGNTNYRVNTMKHYLGTASQVADADLIAAPPGDWTTDDRLRGIPYSIIRFSSHKYIPAGIPKITALVRGKNDIYDPRTGITGWTDNAALCAADYLCDSTYGLGVDYATEINESELIAAANTCDEWVDLAGQSDTFSYDQSTLVAIDSDTLALDTDTTTFHLGDRVTISSTGTLPTGLSAGTYYYIPVGDKNTQPLNNSYPRHFKLATSYANAVAGTAVSITGAGSGTHTLTRDAEHRYTCNGAIDSDQEPQSVIEALNSAKASPTVWVMSEGKWHVRAGAYTAPTLPLDESDLRGSIRVEPTFTRDKLFNAVKGKYMSPANQWQPSDFPPVTNSTYETQDGEQIWRDIQLPFTTSTSAAQRLAKIELERHRQQITFTAPCKLSALEAVAGGTVKWSVDQLGWTDKPFEVVDCNLVTFEDDDGVPALGVDLVCRETASTIYDWNNGEETTQDPAPNTDLPDAFSADAPTNLTLASGDSHLLIRSDGSVLYRIQASWTAPANEYDENILYYDVQWKLNSESDWVGTTTTNTSFYIAPIQDAAYYDVRVRAVKRWAISDWLETTNYQALGKSANPGVPTSTSVTAVKLGIQVSWTNVASTPDLWGVEIWRSNTSTFGDGASLGIAAGNSGEATSYTDALDAGTTRYYWIRSRDTSGNSSSWVNLGSATASSVATGDVDFNYAGSTSKGGNANDTDAVNGTAASTVDSNAAAGKSADDDLTANSNIDRTNNDVRYLDNTPLDDLQPNESGADSTSGQMSAGIDLTAGFLKNGSNIKLDFANKRLSINDETFGNSGIQAEHNGGNPRAYFGDGGEKYFAVDLPNDEVRVGRDVQFRGTDSYNADATYLASLFESPDALALDSTGGTATTDTGGLYLHLTSTTQYDIVYARRRLQRTLRNAAWTSGQRRFKTKVQFSGNWTDRQAYITTGYAGAGSGENLNAFGFKIVAGSIYSYVHDDNGSGTTSNDLSISVGTGERTLEAVLDAGGSVKFYVDGTLEDTITSNLPANENDANLVFNYVLDNYGINTTSFLKLQSGEVRFLYNP